MRRCGLSTARDRIVCLSLLLLCASLAACRSEGRQPLVVFHAASLSGALSEAKEKFERLNPAWDVRLEASGSQVAARKVAELNARADLVISADWQVIEKILIPAHADAQILFAGNEIVLAYGQHSRFGNELSADNWPKILSRSDVKLGRVDEALAPLGYQTLQVWMLEERVGKAGSEGLTKRLKQSIPAERIVTDAAELVSLLEARVIDYAFLPRNLAEEHRLKVLRLPKEVNLGARQLASVYAQVRVLVTMDRSQPPVELLGAPILLSLCIPKVALHPEGAESFASFLIGPESAAIFRRRGFEPLPQALSLHPEKLPALLRSRVLALGAMP